ncbi:hypothetical protein [Burkholderia pyrrocinia]|uniref:hypothetical protein n=1 Tax=Burkholderia pyrrocinia TaxID=60550 RepID=UPI0012601EA8|nr:hypothetical protein [Burkholderia pyrrocinia]
MENRAPQPLTFFQKHRLKREINARATPPDFIVSGCYPKIHSDAKLFEIVRKIVYTQNEPTLSASCQPAAQQARQ